MPNLLNSVSVIFIFVTCGVKSVFPQLLSPEYYKVSEDGNSTFPELAAKYGHPAETEYVITEDGYNLTLYHIPGDPERSVLLVHGNTVTADCWVSRGNVSLGITLAADGYDVWLINLRGSRYSRRHLTLDADKDAARFFNFSMHEQGVYDMPATIDFVLKKTNQPQTLVVAHSLGTTALYILGAEKPKYNDKIKLAISLSPICFVKHMRNFLVLISPFILYLFIGVLKTAHVYELLDHDQSATIIQTLCLQPLGYEICIKDFTFPLFGANEEGMEPEFINTWFGQWPGGSSLKTFEHLVQIIIKDRFVKFSYGKRNDMVYNSLEAPAYDFTKVTMKTALIGGRNDLLTSQVALDRLNRLLPNVVLYQWLPDKKFTHMDFVLGQKIDKNLHPYVLPLIEKFI